MARASGNTHTFIDPEPHESGTLRLVEDFGWQSDDPFVLECSEPRDPAAARRGREPRDAPPPRVRSGGEVGVTTTDFNVFKERSQERRARKLALVALAVALRHSTPLDGILIALSDPELPLRAAIAEAAQVDSPSGETWAKALDMIRVASERSGS